MSDLDAGPSRRNIDTPPGDRARVSAMVAVPPAQAFDIFTRETGLWWGDLLSALREHAARRP